MTTNFADYLLPGATEVPNIEVTFAEYPSPLNPLGVKGVGESGCVPAAGAIVSAIENALDAVRRADRRISGDAGAAVQAPGGEICSERLNRPASYR